MACGKGVKHASVVEVSTTAVQLVGGDTGRACVYLHNQDTDTIYIGPDSTVSSTTGIPVAQNTVFHDEYSYDPWYGITASGTSDMTVMDVRG